MAPKIQVRLKNTRDRSYTIAIRSDVLQSLPRIIATGWKRSRLFIISDTNVGKLYGTDLQKAFFNVGIDARLLLFHSGEKHKNTPTIQRLHTSLLRNGVRRDSLIIALGGGVVGDVAGYVAATILRGIPFIQVPTTLLAMVDASIGGKVGVNLPQGKNLIGAFNQPAAVLIDPQVL
ncbi:MAG: iron-containing alcohol dehydrogenase, partial [bacterium]